MKKFFSLVLALVMALSLTTIAWGAGPWDVNGTGYATFAEAMAAVTDNTETTVTLTANTTENIVIPANKIIVLDLGDKILTGKITVETTNACVIKNGTIDGTASGRGIVTFTDVNLSVEDVVIDVTGTGNTQGLTISGYGTGLSTISLKNCEIDARTAGYAIIDLTKTNLTIDGCDIYGYAALYMKDDSLGTAGSADSVVTVKNGSTLTGYGHAGASNAFGTIVFETDGIEVNIENGSTIDNEGDTTQQKLFEINGNTDNIVAVPAEYADDLVEEGYVVTANSDGSVSIAGISAPAPAGGDELTAKYDMVTTDISQTKTVMVTVTAYSAVKPKDTSSPKDGLYDVPGNIKYVVFSNLPGKYFVQVNSSNDGADYTVYQAGTTTLFGYFKEIVSPYYLGNGVAFYDFGEKCGQYDDTPTVGAKYYTFQDTLYVADPTYASPVNLMVGNALVSVIELPNEWVGHTPAFTYDDDYEVVAVKCAECGTPGVIVPNYKSLPKAIAKGVENVDYFAVNGTEYYYWLAGPGAVVDTETKVESAETFDAGIAMYVGMSVMAAAGSAVVIGKKKD